MNSELSALTSALSGELFFYLENGPLKSRLIESYLKVADAHAEILEFEHNASVRLVAGEGAAPATFDCRLEADDFQYQIILVAEDFSADEVAELLDRLRPLCPLIPKQKTGSGRNIIRKKQGAELLGIAAAAKALELSHRMLKALIPCSEVRIAERGGDKTIKEFYWETALIARFESLAAKQQAGRGYNREDLTSIAESCCDGDRQWARDTILGFLQQRNRSENHRQ